jgi:hypothetical protein
MKTIKVPLESLQLNEAVRTSPTTLRVPVKLNKLETVKRQATGEPIPEFVEVSDEELAYNGIKLPFGVDSSVSNVKHSKGGTIMDTGDFLPLSIPPYFIDGGVSPLSVNPAKALIHPLQFFNDIRLVNDTSVKPIVISFDRDGKAIIDGCEAKPLVEITKESDNLIGFILVTERLMLDSGDSSISYELQTVDGKTSILSETFRVSTSKGVIYVLPLTSLRDIDFSYTNLVGTDRLEVSIGEKASKAKNRYIVQPTGSAKLQLIGVNVSVVVHPVPITATISEALTQAIFDDALPEFFRDVLNSYLGG